MQNPCPGAQGNMRTLKHTLTVSRKAQFSELKHPPLAGEWLELSPAQRCRQRCPGRHCLHSWGNRAGHTHYFRFGLGGYPAPSLPKEYTQAAATLSSTSWPVHHSRRHLSSWVDGLPGTTAAPQSGSQEPWRPGPLNSTPGPGAALQ